MGEEADNFIDEGDQELNIDNPLLKHELLLIEISSKGVAMKPKCQFFEFFSNGLLQWGNKETDFDKYEHSALLTDVSLIAPKEIVLEFEKQQLFFTFHTNFRPLHLIAPNLRVAAQWLDVATNMTRDQGNKSANIDEQIQDREKIHKISDLTIQMVKSLLQLEKEEKEEENKMEMIFKGIKTEATTLKEYDISHDLKTIIENSSSNIYLLGDLIKKLKAKSELIQKELDK